MDNLSNSFKSKEQQKEEKKIEPIVSGKVQVKKQNDVQKFASVFFPEDIKNVRSFIMTDVIIPAMKRVISDIFSKGIDMLLYGNSGSGKRSGASKISYTDYYDSPIRRSSNDIRMIRSVYNYDNIILSNRGEAQEVLERMDEIISIYGTVSVADLYDLVGVTGNWTDNKYGWNDLRNASVMTTRDGYLLKLPKAMPLN